MALITSTAAGNSSRSRRIGLILAIIVVGGGLVLWSSHRAQTQAEEIHKRVTDLCESILRDDRIPTGITISNAAITEQLRLVLKGLSQNHGDIESNFTIEVQPGDYFHSKDHPATHIALIYIADDPQLGLRLTTDEQRGVIVLGYWLPQAFDESR